MSSHPRADNPFAPGARVAAYLRDSGGETQDLSTAQQESVIRAWCAERGLLLSRLFVDEAAPGSSAAGRAAFLEMIDHFTGGQADEAGVVVWKFSRFAREIDDAQFYKADLRRRGYEIHSINENVPHGLDGRLFEAAIDWMNARFLQDLSQDVRRGLHHLLLQHGALGGTPPRGFRRSRPLDLGLRRNGQRHLVHRWEPDPEKTDLVRLAFELRASGASYAEITRQTALYRDKSSWAHFFANPLYIGRLEFGGQVIEDYCEPIVSRETWEAVQKMNAQSLEKRDLEPGRHPRALRSDYLLTGLLRCARCGGHMTGETSRAKRGEVSHRYYACTAKKRTFGVECQAANLPKDYLELVILDETVEHIYSLENLERIYSQAHAERDSRAEAARRRLSELEEQRAGLRRQLKNLAEALAEMGRSRAVAERIAAKEAELQQLEEKFGESRIELQALTNLPPQAEVQELAGRLAPLLRSVERPALRRWLHALIERIEVERVGNKIVGCIYYYTPDKIMPTGQCPHSGYIHRHDFSVPCRRGSAIP